MIDFALLLLLLLLLFLLFLFTHNQTGYSAHEPGLKVLRLIAQQLLENTFAINNVLC
jgi:hypothetical protein